MAGSAVKQRVLHPLQKSVVNPLVKLAWGLGIPPPGDALLETTGRRTGQPRRTPVCDGLEGETFWLVAQQGRRANWVRNIEANPRVRVKVRSGWRAGWRSGTAHILDDDDPHERQRILGRGNLARWLCVSASRGDGHEPADGAHRSRFPMTRRFPAEAAHSIWWTSLICATGCLTA